MVKKGSLRKLLLLMVIFAVCFGILQRYAAITSLNRSINKTQQEVNTLNKECEHFHISISKLKSIDRIEKIAVEQLNMKKPDKINYVLVARKADSTDVSAIESLTADDGIAYNKNSVNSVIAMVSNALRTVFKKE